MSGDEEFDRFFAQDVMPWLEEEELKRRLLAERARRKGYITAAATFAIGILAFYFRLPIMVVGVILALGGLTSLAWGIPLYLWSGTFNEALTRKIFGHFGYDYRARPSSHFLERFSGLGLLPSYDSYHLSDEVSGKIDGMAFQLVEAHLSRTTRTKKGSTKTLVFHGVLLSADFLKPFEGRTLIKTDQGAISHFLQDIFGDGSAVRLEDPAFEAQFDVYSNDQIEARRLLTPAFMERLLTLRRRMDAPVRGAFYRQKFWLAVDGRRDYFPAYSAWEDVRKPEQAIALIRDISLISDIVRVLRLGSETHV